jgi:hypothetical protein
MEVAGLQDDLPGVLTPDVDGVDKLVIKPLLLTSDQYL